MHLVSSMLIELTMLHHRCGTFQTYFLNMLRKYKIYIIFLTLKLYSIKNFTDFLKFTLRIKQTQKLMQFLYSIRKL